MTDLARTATMLRQANAQRIEEFKRGLADEGLLTVSGEVLEPVGEGAPIHREITDTPSPALPGHVPVLARYEFENQVTTALADLFKMCKKDRERFHSFKFQDTVLDKINDAVADLEEAL